MNNTEQAAVQFSSVQDGICELGKAHMRSTPSLRSFPKVVFETVPLFDSLMMALSSPFKEYCLALLQAVDGVMSLASCPQVVSQAPQHLSSEKQATCEGCLACKSICSVISLHVQGSTPTGVFGGGCQPLTHSSLGFPFHFSHFVASSVNLLG